MKPGRNDPCHCGSGKKYKHCHLAADNTPRPEVFVWERLRRANEGLVDSLFETATDHFGPTGFYEAWDEFTLFEDKPFDAETRHMQVFGPWFLHNWRPDPDETETPARSHDFCAAEAYLQRRGARLDPLAARYIAACNDAYFSFHEIVTCEPGHGFRLRDVLLGREVDVIERLGSEYAQPGNIIFAKVVPIEGIMMLDGCATFAIPPVHKLQIIELRKAIRSSRLKKDRWLREWEFEIRETYLDLADRLLNPRLPEMRNTDNEPIEIRTLQYKIESVPATFDALKHLTGDSSDTELESEIERDRSGAIVAVDFGWKKDASDTILGFIEISGNRLRMQTNSAERAQRFEAIVTERLGSSARALPQTIESVESMLRTRRESGDTARRDAKAAAEQAALMQKPEVQAAINAMLRKHYQGWVDEKLPALGHRTPRQMVKTKDGREAVEALLAHMARSGPGHPQGLDPTILGEIRARLGLPG